MRTGRTSLGVLLGAAVLCVAAGAPAQPAPGWSMYHGGVQGLGCVHHATTIGGARGVVPLWQVKAPGGIWGSPIEDFANNTVIVATNAVPELYVLDKPTGMHMFGSPRPLTDWSDSTGCIDTLTMNLIVGSNGLGGPGSVELRFRISGPGWGSRRAARLAGEAWL